MTPVWKKPQDLGIRPARKPQQDSPLSGIVVIYDGERHGRANIRFPDSARARIAKHMPMGIGPADPAYISVEHELDCYSVYCLYAYTRGGILMWRQKDLPSWIASVKYSQI
jgi:hypothetical protein